MGVVKQYHEVIFRHILVWYIYTSGKSITDSIKTGYGVFRHFDHVDMTNMKMSNIDRFSRNDGSKALHLCLFLKTNGFLLHKIKAKTSRIPDEPLEPINGCNTSPTCPLQNSHAWFQWNKKKKNTKKKLIISLFSCLNSAVINTPVHTITRKIHNVVASQRHTHVARTGTSYVDTIGIRLTGLIPKCCTCHNDQPYAIPKTKTKKKEEEK